MGHHLVGNYGENKEKTMGNTWGTRGKSWGTHEKTRGKLGKTRETGDFS